MSKLLTIEPHVLVLRMARGLTPVREVPPNHGRFVNAIQTYGGGVDGEPWCAYFVYYVGHTILADLWPLPRTGSCDALLAYGKGQGMLRTAPVVGGLFLALRGPTDAYHVGFVEALAPKRGPTAFRTLEGNSNELGSSEGLGVFSNVRGTTGSKVRYAFLDWETLIP